AEPGAPAEFVDSIRVSANFFGLLGTVPQMGRDFLPGEDIRGNHRVVIISHRFWQNRFGGSPGVIGRTVRINGEPHEIVGVIPETFNDWRHLGWVDVFRPLALTDDEAADRDATLLNLFGR